MRLPKLLMVLLITAFATSVSFAHEPITKPTESKYSVSKVQSLNVVELHSIELNQLPVIDESMGFATYDCTFIDGKEVVKSIELASAVLSNCPNGSAIEYSRMWVDPGLAINTNVTSSTTTTKRLHLGSYKQYNQRRQFNKQHINTGGSIDDRPDK